MAKGYDIRARKARRWKRIYAEKALRVERSDAREQTDWPAGEEKQEYHPTTPADSFAVSFPNTLSPYGVSEEMDALIEAALKETPEVDRVYLGVRVERCIKAESIHLHVLEGVSMNTAVRTANAITPRDGNPWALDSRTTIEEVEDGWLVTLYP